MERQVMTTRSAASSSGAAGVSRRGLLIAATGAAGVLALPAAAQAAGGPARTGSQPDVVGPWFDEMLATFAAAPGAGLPERMWAMSWTAAWAAVSARRSASARTPEQRAAFENAAVATAVHDVLAAQAPTQAARLDDVLAGSLAALPSGEDQTAGITAGRQAAAAVIAARTGDGLDLASVSAPFTLPPEAPGVYRLTPGATQTVAAGYGRARPFLLGRADRFRPAPPPALGTAHYRRDLDEVRRLGGEVSGRSEEQSDLAWLDPMAQYTPVLRLLAADPARSRRGKVQLLAALGTTIVDSSIAAFEAKYVHLHWRPVTAIRAADTDGDPRTSPDPSWTPNLLTPPHPEYPSGHAVTAGAAEYVLSHLVGPRTPVSFTISYARGTGPTVTRTYRRGTPWSVLTRDNIDARVLAGVHFRFSDEVGAELGRDVARFDLRRLTRGDAGAVRVTW
jgi:hypothetical protein